MFKRLEDMKNFRIAYNKSTGTATRYGEAV
jgi:hypothetical protein